MAEELKQTSTKPEALFKVMVIVFMAGLVMSILGNVAAVAQAVMSNIVSTLGANVTVNQTIQTATQNIMVLAATQGYALFQIFMTIIVLVAIMTLIGIIISETKTFTTAM